MTDQASEAMLVLRAQSGDRRALDRLLERHQEALFGYVHGIVSDRELAADVLQDVFIIICRKVKHLRDVRVFRAWAFRIASREAVRAAKREEKRRGILHADPEGMEDLPDPDNKATSQSDWLERLPKLVGRVSPASRTVLLLHFGEEMPLKEVADVLDVPLGTVKSRLNYGLNALRDLLYITKQTNA